MELEYIKIIKTTAQIIHNFIYNNIKLSDQEHATFIAGSLIALQDATFRATYKTDYQNDPDYFVESMMSAIKHSIKSLKGFDIPEKQDIIIAEFDFIGRNEQLKNIVIDEGKEKPAIQALLEKLENIFTLAKTYPEYDILGVFYDQFKKYSASDQQSLGIVLTPYHVSDFMATLLNITPDDVVLDTCCGSSSLLLTAGSKAKYSLGVELNSRMTSISIANMVIKNLPTHLWLGNSFDFDIKNEIRKYHPTKLIINPPYAQQEKELSFVENGLDLLEPNGLGVVIMPVSCANKQDIETKALRKSILSKHTLLASFVMPEQLFAPAVGVNTIICLFKAHVPNENYSTFLGYIKDDGFELSKSEGRIDKNNKWPDIKKEFLDLYNNKQDMNKKSVNAIIKPEAEWSIISYLNIHESVYEDSFFIPYLQQYLMYQIQSGGKVNV
ncbi:MAG: SAM-dependent DNA methyltransferase [Clostridia bacterium]|nr:SAM-dependent DNA methyltransferase [Clostridia bacterium]